MTAVPEQPPNTTVSEPKTKPTKPDEGAYKANLANAEKEHAAAQGKLVCQFLSLLPRSR